MYELVSNTVICFFIGVGTGGEGALGGHITGSIPPQKFHGGPTQVTRAKPTSIAMSAPPPIKKLKQTTLSFGTTTQLDPSTTSTSHREDDSDQEDTHTVTDEEIACTSECCANICDEQGLTPFQPKDSSTIERTRLRQSQKVVFFLQIGM